MKCQAEGSLFMPHCLSLPANCQRDKKRNKRLNKITILSRSCCDKKAFYFIFFSTVTFLFLMHLSCSCWKHLWGKKGLGKEGEENKMSCSVQYTPLNLHLVFPCIFIMCLYSACVYEKNRAVCMCMCRRLPLSLSSFLHLCHRRSLVIPTQKNAISRKRI